jgi:uncharacterized delta-60 repeat protein
VASVNDLPVSKDSIITATEDTIVSGKLEAATDVDGDTLTYAIATGAANGQVVIGKDGSYTYTPNANFNGKDSFTYTINDGQGGVITQTATVNVAAVNDAPEVIPFDKSGFINFEVNHYFSQIQGRMALTKEGKILLVGRNDNSVVIERYNEDGSIDESFGSNGRVSVYGYFSDNVDVKDLFITEEGKIIISGKELSEKNLLMARFNEDGSVDTSFGDNGTVYYDFDSHRGDYIENVTSLGDGRLLVTATGVNYKYHTGLLLAIFDNNGNLDSSFNPDGVGSGAPGIIHNAGNFSTYDKTGFVTSNGEIVVATGSYGGMVLLKYDQQGNLLATVKTGHVNTTFFRIFEDDSGNVLVSSSNVLARFKLDLEPDLTFNNGAGYIKNEDFDATDIEFLDDGRMLITGISYSSKFTMAIYNSDGTLDTSFNSEGNFSGQPGILITDFETANRGQYLVKYDTAITDEGNILLFATVANDIERDFEAIVVKFDLNGNRVTSFGSTIGIKATQNSDLVMKVDDFNFSDSDGDQLKAIIIDALPESGELLLNGVSISTGQAIDVSSIESGQLIYRSETNITNDQDININYRVQDNGGTENGGVDISEQSTLVIKVLGTNTNSNLEDVVNEHFSESINLGNDTDTYYDSSASLPLSFDSSVIQMQTLIDSPQIELPSIDDLLDVNSNELIFEQADVSNAIPSSYNDVTSVSKGATDNTAIAADFTMMHVQDINDMQTEAMFHIM